MGLERERESDKKKRRVREGEREYATPIYR